VTIESQENAYDQTPYPMLSYGQTHPDRAATIATLLGLTPAPVTACRVLELGCALGGNIVPMAYALPGSDFVGVDYSARQIATGHEYVKALGLGNVSLVHMDILDFDPSLGPFDYIIAHGVYSWVPPQVRDRLLQLCRHHLSEQGVAYISYNTYPGWHMMGTMRDMMLYHTRATPEPLQRVAEARQLISFMASALPAGEDAFASFIGYYNDMLSSKLKSAETLLLHDELEEVNDPVYFHQFAAHAESHGLQYLGEAEFPSMIPTNFEPVAAEGLMKLAHSLVELEQYMDFLRNRTFRQTLLCHQEVAVSRTLRVTSEQMRLFFLTSAARPVADKPDISGDSVESFKADRATFKSNHPLTKAAFVYLGQVSPHSVPFDELVEGAANTLVAAGGQRSALTGADVGVLVGNLLQAYSYSMKLIQLHLYAPNYSRTISERPVASPVARYLAARSPLVTNMRHERSDLDGFTRYVLLQLDGSRDRAALFDQLTRLAAEGALKRQEAAAEDEEPEAMSERLGRELDHCLNWLARAALLVA
jgi:methyltransferase-like protein/SAM-dependent methyltransferase